MSSCEDPYYAPKPIDYLEKRVQRLEETVARLTQIQSYTVPTQKINYNENNNNNNDLAKKIANELMRLTS